MNRRYVKTETILDQILAHKLDETETCKAARPLAVLEQMIAEQAPPGDFAAALREGPHVALIAEVKKASPSKGVLIEHFDPVALGSLYAQNGASAISVLTDERFFMGNIRYMQAVKQHVAVPVLCKEFVIDPYQIHEARAFGADAVLLIVMALDDAVLRDLHARITDLGMAALVEVHNEAELERALALGARLIGVNNRDLRTFTEDLTVLERLSRHIPSEVTLVAESAIRSASDVMRMGQAGAHAVLVGEGLVKSVDIASAVRAFSTQKRQHV